MANDDDVEVIKGGSKKQPEQAHHKPSDQKPATGAAPQKPAAVAPQQKPASAPAQPRPAAAAAKPATAPTQPKPAPAAPPKPVVTSTPKPAAKQAAQPRVPSPGSDNPMRTLRVAKVTVNIGVGQSGERLEKAEKVLAVLTGHKPVRTIARKAIRDWNVREGTPIGVKVTIRGDDAIAFVKRALWTRNQRVANWSFDKEGNLLFGVPDHTSFEGQKYNPEVGIFGMDIAVTVERAGFRIKRRRLVSRRVPPRHRVDRVESQAFLRSVLGLEIV
jgi:large subunit ribosomal protein L5